MKSWVDQGVWCPVLKSMISIYVWDKCKLKRQFPDGGPSYSVMGEADTCKVLLNNISVNTTNCNALPCNVNTCMYIALVGLWGNAQQCH